MPADLNAYLSGQVSVLLFAALPAASSQADNLAAYMWCRQHRQLGAHHGARKHGVQGGRPDFSLHLAGSLPW